jgi:hypothetical protein
VRRYQLISADSHVNEPPDLWTARVPSAFRERAPRMQRFEQGDAWIIEGAEDPINFGMNAVAGLPPDQISSWKRFEDIRPGGYDPLARATEMDQDGVDAEVLYPTPRLGQAVAATTDPELHLALVRAYNELVVGVLRAEARAVRRSDAHPQPGCRSGGGRDRARRRQPRHLRCAVEPVAARLDERGA